MKIVDYLPRTSLFYSFTMLTALLLAMGAYLSAQAMAVEGAVLEVDTIEELYEAVNNPNNAGATIKLLVSGSPYVLDPTKPNAGRLVLRPGMSLIGESVYFDHNGDGVPDPKAEDPEIFADNETVIEGENLTGPRGIIEVGNSNQSISKVTVRGNRSGIGDIVVGAASNSVSNVNVSETILENGRRGIEVTNAQTNAEIDLVAERNIIRHNIISPNQGFACEDSPSALPSGDVIGWGIRIFSSGSGPRISAHLSHNRFYDNKINLFLPTVSGQDGVTTVVSESNIFEEAVFTCAPDFPSVISASIFIFIRDFENPSGSHRNRIQLISHDDAIWNNGGWTGVYAEIRRDSNDVEIIGNEIEAEFHNTRFVKMKEDGKTFDGLQNRNAAADPPKRRDITIVGLNDSGSNDPWPQPGIFTGPTSDNKIKVKVKQGTSSLMKTVYDNNPKPFVVFDNAPDQVQVELELEEIDYIASKKKK